MAETIVVQPTVYTIEVTPNDLGITVTAPGPQGPVGPQGPPGIDTGYYEYIQVAQSATWNITHNLGINPAVTAVDSAGNVVEGTLLYLTTDTLRISFGVAISGRAYMS
jgi:hypothetical protein